MYEFTHQLMEQGLQVFMINISHVDDNSDALVDAVPGLLHFTGDSYSEYIGMDQILDFIQSQQ